MKKSQPDKNQGVGSVGIGWGASCSQFLSMPRKHLAIQLCSSIPVMESYLTISKLLSLCLRFCSVKDANQRHIQNTFVSLPDFMGAQHRILRFGVCGKRNTVTMMRITVLGCGTSQGVPVIGCDCPVCRSKDPRDKRTRTSILIETELLTIAVDAGPDFRQQMLRENVTHLDAVLITHEHKDHIGGLDDLRPFIFSQKAPMPIYASAEAQVEIKREYSYAFDEHPYPGAPDYRLVTLDETPFDLGGLHIEPIKLQHYTLTCYAFRIGKFAYVTDLSEMPESAMERLRGIDYLIIEALGLNMHYSHLNLSQAREITERLNVKKAWFTHLSHRIGLTEQVNRELPENMNLAYDGLKFEIHE